MRMSSHLDISVSGSGSTVEITLTGELDVASDRRLSELLKQLAEGGTTNVVIDLRGVTLMDSAGLRWLITADALSQAEGFRLWIVRGPGAVERTLAATGMDARLPMVDRPPALGGQRQNAVEAGQLHGPADLLRPRHDSELVAVLADALPHAQQGAEAARVDELDIAEVDHEATRAQLGFCDRAVEVLLTRDVELAAQADEDRVAVLLRGDLEVLRTRRLRHGPPIVMTVTLRSVITPGGAYARPVKKGPPRSH
jgi:anti-anti-sigma factor